MIVTDLKYFIRELESLLKHYRIANQNEYKQQREQYSIIKSMHSIEKGMSLNEIKIGFGERKVVALMNRLEKYSESGFDCNHESVQMAMCAIAEYIQWHKDKNVLNKDIEKQYEKLMKVFPHNEKSGGTRKCVKSEILDFDCNEFDKVLYSRRSIRNFSDEEVNSEIIMEAVKRANRCPSACNRQPTKVYIVKSMNARKYLADHLQGTGGFAEKCKCFLIVTGSVAAFNFTENNQWLINAGIFVGTLELTLHSSGIASCVINSPLVRSKNINEMRNLFKIPEDEEIVCFIGIGMYPDEFSVPFSKRLPINKIAKEI